MKRTVAAILLTALVLSASIFSSLPKVSATTTPKTALIYGDSLTWESQWQIRTYFATKTGWTNVIHGFPGTAVCDWIPTLSQDLATYHPSIVGIETAGNYTRPCMLDANGNQLAWGSDAFYAKYKADLDTFFATVTATGAKLVFMTAPPMLDPSWNTSIIGLQKVATQLAAAYPGVSVSAGPRNAVSATGVYQAYKPCLTTETAAMGCDVSTGQIPIRTISGIQTGVHLCPTGLTDTFPFACATYSSGEYRFGRAEASTVVTPPAPIRPTVVLSAVSGVEGTSFDFKPTLLYPYSQDLALCYSTADGTALVSAGDYVATSGCFTIPAWTTVGPIISVQTLVDHVTESTAESFKLKIWGWVVPITGTTKTVNGTIKANTT